jgi:hypothetical protein
MNHRVSSFDVNETIIDIDISFISNSQQYLKLHGSRPFSIVKDKIQHYMANFGSRTWAL